MITAENQDNKQGADVSVLPIASGKDHDTGHDSLDTGFLHQPIPAGVLKLLLDRLDVSVQAGALAQACEQSQKTLAEAPPTQRISFIFNALQLKGIQAAQLRWSRFDQRRLPAMLFYRGQWHLVERAGDGLLALTNEAGECREYSEESLKDGLEDGHEDNMVLWLRTAPKREQASPFSLKGNIALRLVLRIARIPTTTG